MKKIIILFVICSFMAISGCSTWGDWSRKKSSSGEGEGASMGLSMSESLKFEDIPIPAGFKMNPENSFAFQNKTMRVGVLTYIGKASPQEIISFYKEQMPLYNWRLLNLIEYGTIQILFDKGTETCVITITPARKSTLRINVAPKSKGK